MLYHLALALKSHSNLFNIVHYISFRAIAGMITAFVLSLALGLKFIQLSKQTFQNKARPFTPQNHQTKGSTPTMGGILIIAISACSILLWSDLTKYDSWIILLTLVLFGSIGLIDDLSKVWYKKGLSARTKFRLQLICALILTIAWIFTKNPTTVICTPFLKGLNIDLGWLIIPWSILVIVGTSNAVNLTDGLDGLAIGTLILNFSFFTGISYIAGHAEFAHYLHIPFADSSQLTIVGAILTGASLGFLWFNTYPAQIFMGDVGSLSLGATLGMMALMTKQELLLPITGGVFVIEALSVIAQIFSIKKFGKKLLRMAPLHHHFELQGWPESKVTTRFHLVTLILCLCAAITLKIR